VDVASRLAACGFQVQVKTGSAAGSLYLTDPLLDFLRFRTSPKQCRESVTCRGRKVGSNAPVVLPDDTGVRRIDAGQDQKVRPLAHLEGAIGLPWVGQPDYR